jgi:hypothetical protein
MAVFSAVVNPGTGFDEDVLDVDQFWDLGLCRRIAAQLVGHDLARCLGASGKNALEKLLGCRLVPTFLQQDIELDAVLIDCSPQQIGFAAQCHEHFVEVPGRARRATRSLDAMREPREVTRSGSDRAQLHSAQNITHLPNKLGNPRSFSHAVSCVSRLATGHPSTDSSMRRLRNSLDTRHL